MSTGGYAAETSSERVHAPFNDDWSPIQQKSHEVWIVWSLLLDKLLPVGMKSPFFVFRAGIIVKALDSPLVSTVT